MNLLRVKRKKFNKVKPRRFLYIVFSLIMVSFAWFTFSKILNSEVKLHINSWNIEFFLDKNKNNIPENYEKISNNAMEINVDNLYPGMDDQVINVIIRNTGETPSTISYTTPEIYILGEQYEVVEEIPENSENGKYILKSDMEPVTKDGLSKVTIINDLPRIPFTVEMENTEMIYPKGTNLDSTGLNIVSTNTTDTTNTTNTTSETSNVSDGLGYLKVKVKWKGALGSNASKEEKDAKNSLDTEWGYKVVDFFKSVKNSSDPNVIKSALRLKFSVNAIGQPRGENNKPSKDNSSGTGSETGGEELSTAVSNDNIGDYIDLGNDIVDYNGTTGVTTDDWRIIYKDDNYVYVILSDYLPATKVPAVDGLCTNPTEYPYSAWTDKTEIDSSDDTYYPAASEFIKLIENKEIWNTFTNGISGATAKGSATASLLFGHTMKEFISDLYFLNKDEYPFENCYGYWLSDGSAKDKINFIDCENKDSKNAGSNISSAYVNSKNCGFRPVVSLPLTTKVEKVNGVWTVKK